MVSFEGWAPQTLHVDDVMDPWRARAMQATLGRLPDAGDPEDLPCLWHWMYFLELSDRADLDVDGHARRGDFLPPIDLPRRMFAGSRTTVERPLRLGVPASATFDVSAVNQKRGGDNPLFVVTITARYSQAGHLCVIEEKDIVYLGGVAAPPVAEPPQPAPDGDWALDLTPDAVMLMRFSALTFNGHRIHYDRDYAADVEGYPDRLVHGPLTAILLVESVRRTRPKGPSSFTFRAERPLIVDQPLRLRGGHGPDGAVWLRAYDPLGRPAVSATATLPD